MPGHDGIQGLPGPRGDRGIAGDPGLPGAPGATGFMVRSPVSFLDQTVFLKLFVFINYSEMNLCE